MTKEFVIHYYQDEDGIFTAIVPAIKGCIASGKTLNEAYENACDAIESCIEARKKISAEKEVKDFYQDFNHYKLSYA